VVPLLTSDLVEHQVHLAVGALPQLPDHLVVLVHLQPLQVLGRDQLQLVQYVHVGTGAQRGGAHGGMVVCSRRGGRTIGDGTYHRWGGGRGRGEGRVWWSGGGATVVANAWCHCREDRGKKECFKKKAQIL